MSHHGREYEDDRDVCGVACSDNYRKLSSAVALITSLSRGECLPDVVGICDAWLDANGYDCAIAQRKQRERRAVELDTQIERLRAERAKL